MRAQLCTSCVLGTTGSRQEGSDALGSPMPAATCSTATATRGKGSELPPGALLPSGALGGFTGSVTVLWQGRVVLVAAAEFVGGVTSLTPR